MNQKGIAPLIIVAIVVVVVVVAGVGIYLATRGGGGGGGGTTIAEATSLQCTESSTTGGVSTTGTFWAKDIGTSNAKVRFEGTAAGVSMTLIVNGALQKIWVYANGTWHDLSSSFTTYWNEWHGHFENLRAELSTWKSGTWTSPDGTETISNIQVNPSLADSLFVHSE